MAGKIYMGLQSSIWSNRLKTIGLIILFPLSFFLIFIIIFGIDALQHNISGFTDPIFWNYVFQSSGNVLLIITPIIIIRFIISFSLHRQLIFKFSGAKPITRKTNLEIYNIVENLCLSKGLPVPNIGIIEDDSLNAFATGRKPGKTWIVFSRGIINKLNKQEIEAVAGHELTHIMNKDTLLMVCIIVFVGVVGTLGEILMRTAGRFGRGNNRDSGQIALAIFLLGIALMILGYLFFPLIRLSISRKREYLADAGSVELTKDKYAMISALQKISQDSKIESIKKTTVAAMCIESPFDKNKKRLFGNLFKTHPSINDRISALNQY